MAAFTRTGAGRRGEEAHQSSKEGMSEVACRTHVLTLVVDLLHENNENQAKELEMKRKAEEAARLEKERKELEAKLEKERLQREAEERKRKPLGFRFMV